MPADELTLAGIRAWALMLIARGETTGELGLDAAGFSVPLGASDAQEVAEAAIRGDADTVTARVPSGLSRENAEAICREQR